MSRLPLEQMMASLRSLVSSPKSGTTRGSVPGVSVVTVMTISFSLRSSHAAARLGQPGDVRHLLGGFAGEQLEQGLHRDAEPAAHPAQGRGVAGVGLVGPQE